MHVHLSNSIQCAGCGMAIMLYKRYTVCMCAGVIDYVMLLLIGAILLLHAVVVIVSL